MRGVPDALSAKEPVEPRAPLGHLSRLGLALVGASAIDDVARSLLTDLAALPGVGRVGFALTEGGGRRLRLTASDRSDDDRVDWCHIDAYDDVPLTAVVRTGEPVLGDRESLDPRYDEFVAGQPVEVRALAAVPLPGIGSPIGGLIVFLDEEWAFDDAQRGLLDATARRAADAVRRIRVGSHDLHEDDPAPTDDGTLTARFVLDDDPRAAPTARRFLREFLRRADVPDDVAATAELCLSEPSPTRSCTPAAAPSSGPPSTPPSRSWCVITAATRPDAALTTTRIRCAYTAADSSWWRHWPTAGAPNATRSAPASGSRWSSTRSLSNAPSDYGTRGPWGS